MTLANESADGFITSADVAAASDIFTFTNTDISIAEFKLVVAGTTCDSSLTYGAIPKTSDSVLVADGNYRICVKAQDLAGNIAYAGVAGPSLDLVAPAFNSIALANEISDTYLNSADSSATNPLFDTLDADGEDLAEYKVVLNATSCTSGLTYSTTMPTGTSIAGLGDGLYKLCVKVSDAGPNPAAYGASPSFTIDKTAPSGISPSGVNAGVDNKISDAEKNQTNTMFNITASEPGTVMFTNPLSTGTPCNNSLTYTNAILAPNDFGSDGDFKACIKFTDTAGNSTIGAGTGIITRDTSLPTVTGATLDTLMADGYANIDDITSSNPIVHSVVSSG